MTLSTSWPEGTNFFSTADLKATLENKLKIVRAFRSAKWKIRNSGFDEFEASCEWAEIEIYGDGDIVFVNGTAVSIEDNASKIVSILKSSGYSFSAEWYNEKEELLHETTINT